MSDHWRANQDAAIDAGLGPEDADDFGGPTTYTWALTIDGDAEGWEMSSATSNYSICVNRERRDDGTVWFVQEPFPQSDGTYLEWSFPTEIEAARHAANMLLESFFDGSDGAAAAERRAERAYDR